MFSAFTDEREKKQQIEGKIRSSMSLRCEEENLKLPKSERRKGRVRKG